MSIDEVLENLNRSLDRVLESLEDDMDVDEYTPEEPTFEMRPCVRIVHAGGPHSWYKDKVGQLFRVVQPKNLPAYVTNDMESFYFVLGPDTSKNAEELDIEDPEERAQFWMSQWGGDLVKKTDCQYYPKE